MLQAESSDQLRIDKHICFALQDGLKNGGSVRTDKRELQHSEVRGES
jgi:hypothetical protein